jgi:hypothetical protein
VFKRVSALGEISLSSVYWHGLSSFVIMKLEYDSRWVKLYIEVFTPRQKRLLKRGPGRGRSAIVNCENNLHDNKDYYF